MAEIVITRALLPTKGRCIAPIGAIGGEAELTFSLSSATLVSVDRPFAPNYVRGTGAA